MPPPFQTWDEWLHWFLCELYKALGGDCADLTGTSPDRIKKVAQQYKDKGPPSFSTPAEKADFLKLLDNLEDHLDKPENTLDPQDDADLRQLIADLRKDVGP